MATAKEMLDIARKYIGVIEKPNNNVVFNTRYYGREVNGPQYAWCAVFIWCCFKEADALDIFCGGQKTALCQFALDYYRKNGKFYKKDPKVGDLVFFKFGTNQRETDHMGFVESINSDGSVNTIEGNTSDSNQNNGGMVMRKKRSSKIVGYARPDYDEEFKSLPSIDETYPQKGIDMSKYQTGVNYKALRAEGVKFVILKVIRKDLKKDDMFETHYKGCIDAGIPVRAVYNYSYATTVEKAKIDAKRVIEILNGRDIPVVLDVEDASQKNLKERLVQIINAYQSVIVSAGLKFCVYTGLSFYKNFIEPYKDMINTTQFWIARYPSTSEMSFSISPPANKKPDVNGLIGWQYTSNGVIPKAYSGKLDFDILYSSILRQERKTGVITANSLRIRSTPSTSNLNNVVGYLKKGDNVVIYATDVKTGWYQIDLEGKKWISNKYVRLN